MSSPDILFKGIPRGPTRGYTARVISAVQPKLLIVPCTGSFSLAYVARAAGAGAIVCGDISLYSTALGNAIMGTDWRLALKSDDEYAALDAILPKGDVDKVYLANRDVYEGWRAALNRTRADLEIVNAPTALAEMARLAVERLDELEAE